MLSTNNIFSPAHGNPIIAPSQDIVMGMYYLTVAKEEMQGGDIVFSSSLEVHTALGAGKIHGHATARVRLPEGKQVYKAHGKTERAR